MLKLNNKGFSFHIVLPILALLAVGSIGAYMTFRSSAAIPVEGWKTIKSMKPVGSIKPGVTMHYTYSGASGAVIKTSTGSKYRICVVAKFSSGSSNTLTAAWGRKGIAPAHARTLSPYGKSNTTKCATGYSGDGYSVYPAIKNTSKTTLHPYSIYWQKL